MAQGARALPAFAEDLGLVSSTHMLTHNREPMPSSDLRGYTRSGTHTQIHKISIFFNVSKR